MRLAYVVATVTVLPLLVAGADMCWKESSGRGVGTIPTSCDSGFELINGKPVLSWYPQRPRVEHPGRHGSDADASLVVF